MKKLILNLVVGVFLFSNAFGSHGPDMRLTLLKTEAIEVAFNNILQKSLFKLANYDNESQDLEFVTEKDINYIQIFNSDDVMEFQLQVGSKKVRISKNILDKGVYKLGFIVKDQETIEFLGVKVN